MNYSSRVRKSALPLTLLVSLGLHLLLMHLIVFVPVPPSVAPLAGQPIEIFDRDLVADIDLEPGPGKAIVNSEDTGNHQVPRDTQFLGKKDQSADREQKAKGGAEFSAAEKSGTSAARSPSGHEMKSLSMADLAIDSRPKGQWSIGESTEFEGSVSSASVSNDYLPTTPLGVQTLLNTREYRFFSYIERIRQAIASDWQQDVQRRIDALFLTGRTLNIGQDLITKLAISLNGEGRVTEVSVIRSSGSRTIDHAGESVFHRVGVFPNPPKGIANDLGVITLRWVFALKVTPRIAEANWDQTSPSDSSNERYIR